VIVFVIVALLTPVALYAMARLVFLFLLGASGWHMG
jgi:hypothetical protein